jgi:ATP-dependent helicase HepA
MEKGSFKPGQRLVSDSEPELGLGLVLKADAARVEILFPAANEHRQYARQSAPLRRVQFKPGDRIKLHSGQHLVVESVSESDGLLHYHGAGQTLPESLLSDTLSFSKPEDRLLAAQVDENRLFELRAETLARKTQLLQAPTRGFLGGRIDLLPHQLSIASEVASRLQPRVLLADEVGLGKTIEAGLILHRLHLTGRARRILILLPDSLLHQWFVELWRRFNLLFSLFDAERCQAIEATQPGINPFLENQLILCGLSFLVQNPNRHTQALEAGWDLLIVDEAHHLHWSPEAPSPEYTCVESFAQSCPGLLLLTATPQQLGPESHFARLRLLDPVRYTDLETFQQESSHYQQVAEAIDRVLLEKPLTSRDVELFAEHSPNLRRYAAEVAEGSKEAVQPLIRGLLDAFGTGRVMFRNTRAALKGFPKRKAVFHPLPATPDLREEAPLKIKWLAQELRQHPDRKTLLICRSRPLAEWVHQALLAEINVPAALFHEGLTLVQRDRNAAFFAEPEGAQILICSEIGSEGRNFQFSQHLVLFDVPENPELLEQRIGRLDRIGQSGTIHIHLPGAAGSPGEMLARWYHEGLNAFEKTPHAASELTSQFQDRLEALLENPDEKTLSKLIQDTRKAATQITRKLKHGQDRLLELNSNRPERAQPLRTQILAADQDPGFESFFIRLADHFGVSIESLEKQTRSYLLTPGHLMKEAFPGLTEHGLSLTFQRTKALSREDLQFLTPDHPSASGAIDLFLASETGNSAFGLWKGSEKEGLCLECFFVLECVAPSSLHLDRFLPPTPIHLLIDHALNPLEPSLLDEVPLEEGDISRLLDRGALKKKIIPAMLEKSATLAAEKLTQIVSEATDQMERQLQLEIERLEDLRSMNDHVRPGELDSLQVERNALREALASARLRLDSLRLIQQTC